MKAKCPYCFGENPDCKECKDGFIEVGFKEGSLYTEKCLNKECKFENGGRIGDNVEDWPLRPCVMCKFETKWEYICEMI